MTRPKPSMTKAIRKCGGLMLAEAVLLAHAGCEYELRRCLVGHTIVFDGVEVGSGVTVESAVHKAYNVLCKKGNVKPLVLSGNVLDFFASIEGTAAKKEIVVRWLQSGYMLQFIETKGEKAYIAPNGDVAVMKLLEDIGVAMYAI